MAISKESCNKERLSNNEQRTNEQMNWNNLTNLEQLEIINEESKLQPVLLLKHSTTCSISRMALNRLESKWKEEYSSIIKPYYLDLLTYRSISNEIAKHYDVEHESPQVLIISNGRSIYNESHGGINVDEILLHCA